MKELVIISGKGGTGKTSLTGAFAALAPSKVLADCDVDAADLHLLLKPQIKQHTAFQSGHEAVIRQEDCVKCGGCLARCRFQAVHMYGVAAGEADFTIDPAACEGCGVCVRFCPVNAIDFPERVCGEWYVSDTPNGLLVHARLGIGAENSGKLVTLVRREAQRIAEEAGHPLILVDGPPGIGCPVIASITGASGLLVVTEPTLSGQHDMQRVLELARHFRIPAAVCVNKWDLHPGLSQRIETSAQVLGARPAGRIRYDRAVTAAQVAGKNVIEYGNSPAAEDIRALWQTIEQWLFAPEETVAPACLKQ